MNNIPTNDEIENQKALIGEFIINYEQICSFIRFTIINFFYPDPTSIQNNNIEILLEGMTADPLRKKLKALIHDNFQSENELLDLNKKLSEKFEQMLSIRNSIVHGSLFLGWNNFNGDLSAETFFLKHVKLTKNGIDKNSMIINVDTIKALIKQIYLINNAYSTLSILTTIKDIEPETKKTYLKYLKDTINNIGQIKLDYKDKLIK